MALDRHIGEILIGIQFCVSGACNAVYDNDTPMVYDSRTKRSFGGDHP